MIKFLMLVLALQANFAWALPRIPGNPFSLDSDNSFTTVFSQMPLEASMQGTGLVWSSYYWASQSAVIAKRWQYNASNRYHWRYNTYSKSELKSLSPNDINRLSPAEKYDIYNRQYDYPTVKMARRYGNKRAKVWNGICHGMSPATLNHPEPKTVTLTNADGIEVTFYSSDVKGLLGFYYAYTHSDNPSPQVGGRCPRRDGILGRNKASCKDVDAAAFHIVLANMLGIQGRSFIADIDRWKEVWNHSAYAYKSEVIGKRRTSSGEVVRVKTDITYQGGDGFEPQMSAVLGTDLERWEERHYVYELELNRMGEIVKGKWLSKSRPDFLWFRPRMSFSGHFSSLSDIYKTDY